MLLYAATAAYIILFVLALWQNHWQVDALSSNPLIGPDAMALRSLGSKDTPLIQDGHQWWRLLSSLFLTAGAGLIGCALPREVLPPGLQDGCLAGVINLFSATTCLWTLGKYLEGVLVLPALSVPLIYLVSGISGCLASAVLAIQLDAMGASAAVCGLLGMYDFFWENFTRLLIYTINGETPHAASNESLPDHQVPYGWSSW